MGKPVPLYNVEIQREDGSRCDTGETGEVCIDVHEKAAGIMLEYYRDPEKTAAAVHDGWYHTGDTAWCDEDGYFWYVGRNDDVIKSSGYRIGPFEIESVLLEHEAVRECAVTGVPDPVRGKAVKATIVLGRGLRRLLRAHARAPDLGEEAHRPLQVPAHRGVRGRPAQDRERQDPPRRHPPGGREAQDPGGIWS